MGSPGQDESRLDAFPLALAPVPRRPLDGFGLLVTGRSRGRWVPLDLCVYRLLL